MDVINHPRSILKSEDVHLSELTFGDVFKLGGESYMKVNVNLFIDAISIHCANKDSLCYYIDLKTGDLNCTDEAVLVKKVKTKTIIFDDRYIYTSNGDKMSSI